MKPQYEKTLVESYPILAKLFGSPHPLFNLVAVLPLSYFFIQGFWPLQGNSILFYPLIFFIAWLYWTFFEYAMHRWIYHGRYKNKFLREFVYSFHIYHHQNMQDPNVITAGPLMVLFFTTLLIAPLFWIIPGVRELLSFFAFAVLVNYYFYEWVHHLIHKSSLNNSYMKFIREYHLHHHEKNWKCNYGNTTSLWDRIFKTFEKSW